MKTHLKMTIENHRSSATIVQLQKKLVSLQAEIESWKSTALTLEEQVKQLTKSSSRHDKKRGRTKSTAVQADEAKVSRCFIYDPLVRILDLKVLGSIKILKIYPMHSIDTGKGIKPSACILPFKLKGFQ